MLDDIGPDLDDARAKIEATRDEFRPFSTAGRPQTPVWWPR
jgi:hypothetical protein